MLTQGYPFCVIAEAMEEYECRRSARGLILSFGNVGFWWGHVGGLVHRLVVKA